MAVANYHDTYGHYPPAYIADENGRPIHSWRVLILPFIEEDRLCKEYSFSEPWNGPNNSKLAARMPKMYAFHGGYRPGMTTANYLAVVGAETVWPGHLTVKRDDVIDGTSNTILVVENHGAGVHWMEPRDLACADMDLTINSAHGVSSPYADPAVAMLDAQVYRLKKSVSPAALRAMLTIRGGEQVGPDGKGGWELLPNGRELNDR